MNTFAAILNRVEKKKQDYSDYGFDKIEMAALNTFFDLAQEYDGLENLYLVSVTVPKVFLEVECTLYMTDPESNTIHIAADSRYGFDNLAPQVPSHMRISETMYRHEQRFIFPIHGKKTPTSRILLHGSGEVFGMFEVVADKELAENVVFFLQKYINRIGYNLYNKILAEQNIQHLKFINNLVADIEHNVIVPNLRYKYYFKKMRSYLNAGKEIEQELESIVDEIRDKDPNLYAKITGVLEWLVVANRSVFEDQEKIERHYKNASLFLESLFRRDHFFFGRYVLQKKPCRLWMDLIIPQLERYADRLTIQGVPVAHLLKPRSPGEDLEVKVDKGLISQVLANLFSNVAKYAKSIDDGSGKRKQMNCQTVFMQDFFGKEHDGIKIEVFSSGTPLTAKDSERIFDEGYRVTDGEQMEGTGHGLHFVKNVIEVHGGIVGHTTEKYGNQFYFVIPS